jgi:Flp pilus assembly pilin Flp
VNVLEFFRKFNHDESGQDLVEYAMVLVAVGGAVASASNGVASALGTAMINLNTKLGAWTS